jgi:hypothetical protein
MVVNSRLALRAWLAGAPSQALLFSCLLLVLPRPTSAQVIFINEVMANNVSVIANEGDFSDWVELYNPSASAANISDWSLSDSLSSPRKFVFPAGTAIPAGGYLIVWLDSQTNSPGLHSGFSLSSDTDDLTLFFSAAAGSLQADRIVFGLQPPNVSIGRVPDGSGNWTLNVPTFELANQAMTLAAAVTNNLRINELMANPSGGDDWFELYNTTTNYIGLGGLVFTDQATGATNRAVPALSYIAPGDFIQFSADDLGNGGNLDADHVDFKLGSSSDRVVLYEANRTTPIDRLEYNVAQTNGVSFGRLPDGGTNIVYFAAGRSTPGASNFQLLTDIIINEVLTHTDLPLEDAIELYNPTATPINIGNWWLSNSKDDPKKFRIPANTIVPAGGYRVFYEFPGNVNGFNFNGQGTNRSFTLNSARGDQVYLHTADAAGNLTFFRTSRDFGPAENGVSFGRYITSEGKTDFVPMSRHTFGVTNPTTVTQFRTGTGMTNAYPKIGPMVINEVMYHPPDVFVDGVLVDNILDEYIELYNVSPASVPLFDPAAPTNTWRLRGVVDFNFPMNLHVAAGTYVLVVNFDPTTNTTQLAAFRNKYSVPDGARVFGPYDGKLQNGSGSVELYKPDPPQAPGRPDAGLVPYIRVDRVEYSDDLPWPTAADGTGAALQRIRPEEYGNDPINWAPVAPTPGKQEPLLIQSVQRSGSQTTVRFTGVANSSYSLQYQMALAGGGTSSNLWTKVADVPAQPTTGLRQVIDNTTNPRRFYRIVTPAQ